MDKEYVYFQRLIDLRKEKNKTIADMAYESGLSASTISNYERGVRIPDGKALMKLAGYFDCSTDYLLGLNDYKSIEVKKRQDKRVEELAWYVNGLNFSDKEKIYLIFKMIIGIYEELEMSSDLHVEFKNCLLAITSNLANLSADVLLATPKNNNQLINALFSFFTIERDVRKSIDMFFDSVQYVVKNELKVYKKDGEPNNAEKDEH